MGFILAMQVWLHLLQFGLVVEGLSTQPHATRILSSSINFQDPSQQRQVFPTITARKRIVKSNRKPLNGNNIICFSRKPYAEGVENDDLDDDFSTNTKFSETSREEIGLRRMANSRWDDDFPRRSNNDGNTEVEEDIDDDYYVDENDDGRENQNRGEQRNGRLARYSNDNEDRRRQRDDDDDDDGYYLDDEGNTGEAVAGNFWSNPTNGVDRPPPRISRRGKRQQQRNIYDDDEDTDYENDGDDDDDGDSSRRQRRRQTSPRRRPQQQQRSRTPARTGTPQVPQVFKDFYDTIFWFGFDIDESADVGDKTVFGGTKGKFNGFNYISAAKNERSNGSSGRRKIPDRRLPPAKSDKMTTRRGYDDNRRREDVDMDDDYYDDDDDDDDIYNKEINGVSYYDDDDSKDTNKKNTSRPSPSRRNTPPTDEIDDRKSYYDDDDEYTNRRVNGSKNRDLRYDDDEDDEFVERRSGSRRRRRQQNSGDWSPINMIESFLGIDKEEMDYKANAYNSKMGLGRQKLSSQQKRERNRRRPDDQQRGQARDYPERSGYAYRYDVSEDDDQNPPILDIDPSDDPEKLSSRSNSGSQRQVSADDDTKIETRKKERSWEERQIAMEQVPPADVVAWGPSGELPMTAREKAFYDAQEDIQTAQRKLKLLVEKESNAKEEITILKVDSERKRLKLDEFPRGTSRRDVEELRQIGLDIDDASRDLRRSRTRVGRARENLEELEERHHAIMSCYNIDQASKLVGEGLDEISKPFQGTSTSANSANTGSLTK
jgi:hypothetical protein